MNITKEIPRGEVYTLRCFFKEIHIGDAVICDYDNYIEVLHIFVYKDHRGKGYGKELIKYMQDNYNLIITDWKGSSREGKNIFLSMGFKVKKPLHKRKISFLEWRKNANKKSALSTI